MTTAKSHLNNRSGISNEEQSSDDDDDEVDDLGNSAPASENKPAETAAVETNQTASSSAAYVICFLGKNRVENRKAQKRDKSGSGNYLCELTMCTKQKNVFLHLSIF